MENYMETEPIKFPGKRKGMLVGLLGFIIFFTWLFTDNEIWDGLKELLPGNVIDICYGIVLFVALFVALSLIYYVVCYIANSKSYIELTDTHIIINKPIRYPFSSMEMIYLPYEDIETVNIKSMSSGHNDDFLGYKVIFTKKEEFGNTETIKFYGLDDAKNFDKELKKRGVNSTCLNIS